LAILTGLNLCNYLDRYVLPAVQSPIQRELGLSDTQLGAVLAAFTFGYFITSPIFGYLGDRMPRKWLVVSGVLVWCAGTMLSGRAHGFVSLLCFRSLIGFGEASYGTASPAWIADLYAPARRNLALSVFYVAIPVGSALGFIVGGGIAAAYGWRAAFLAAGIPGLLLALILTAMGEPRRGAQDPAADRPLAAPGAMRSFGRLLRLPAYRLVVAGYVAQTFALGAFANWASAFLQRVHHMEMASADRFFGLAVVATGFVATGVGGFWGSAWQRRSRSGYAGVLALSAAAAVPLSFAAFAVPDLFWAKAALVGAMFMLFLSTGPVNTLILETVPVTLRASAMALSIFAIHALGDLWSSALVGWLSDHGGDLRRAVLWTLPGAIAVCALFWGRLVALQRRAPAS
jgi:MFS family permease